MYLGFSYETALSVLVFRIAILHNREQIHKADAELCSVIRFGRVARDDQSRVSPFIVKGILVNRDEDMRLSASRNQLLGK